MEVNDERLSSGDAVYVLAHGRGPLVLAAHRKADHARPVQAGLPAHLHRAPVAHLGVRFVRPTPARPFARSRERGGSDTTK